MSTHKHIDKICYVVLAVTLIVTILFMNAEHLGIQKLPRTIGYEKRLFDTSTVHTVNIIMENWDEFIQSCTSEEYYNCTVVIDNEAYKNVAIRGKGNTSLTQVSSYGNDRYSFKIEFDHFDKTKSYHGLDKLCLNNIIQDNTYMKDFLTYQMMAKLGAPAPLCSYTYITVNGEDWGLYLAVEGVEDSFLLRNFGNNYGELYKPDSMSFGGGRGNGDRFKMEDFFKDSEGIEGFGGFGDFQMPEGFEGFGDFQMPEGFEGFGDFQMPEGFEGFGGFGDFQMPEGFEGFGGFGDFQMPEGFEGFGGFGDFQMPEGFEGFGGFGDFQMPEGFEGFGGFGDFGMPGGMMQGNKDVLLQYIDDNFDSYSNIFDSAKTDITDTDKTRLITALKNLSQKKNLKKTVDMESVIKYFVVHNFVVNFDSYTGSMVHNYYLYENDGQLQMIPWDYNLAFGSFMSMSDATELVNYPIDSPVSGSNMEDRPMIAWIFSDETYLNMYHEYFSKFMSECFESGYFEKLIDSTIQMISPYIEKDPTKFCTHEEFQTGAATLREFCLLRAESVTGQLNGTIGSTSDSQDKGTLVDAGNLQIDTMGSMMGGKGGFGDFGGFGKPDKNNQNKDNQDNNNPWNGFPGGGGQGNNPWNEFPGGGGQGNNPWNEFPGGGKRPKPSGKDPA